MKLRELQSTLAFTLITSMELSVVIAARDYIDVYKSQGKGRWNVVDNRKALWFQ